MNNQKSLLEQNFQHKNQQQKNQQQEDLQTEHPQPSIESIQAEDDPQQQENSSTSDWTSGIDPVALVDLAVELGQGALDMVSSVVENIDLDF
ncbi:hypothetical protein [Acinetobacter shaoyimingii]|uniref:Uncharacterized protein n=1 Tax=Acinetobacter shaoyimingii TaxID=2715164 RepID=A0A6G8RU03_9GAMM|nr:hypothetical protein [Acinetobacter shaoyimingii]NHB58415.1 hypothetical protein [Acinetobacter shaoyimingii]QIO05394.1 hypothetical protein G8E00_05205 [Acinetobacter shaoyimingii]